ncbi:hypothetical protein CJF32_00011197 [Rutstroemia sp. NJR-2017a WRK4]|nr:hypothetical protein CJF32_00011197 [Rutstroemia sp. NJR-2017a WRK4]
MATVDTVQLGQIHPPKEDSIVAFRKIETDLKKMLQHLRHETDKHEPQYFQAVAHLSNQQLANFSSADLKSVRIATSAYGLHLFGKVLLPESDNKYFMFRAFIPGNPEEAKFHCIHMEETDVGGVEGKYFRAIFEEEDRLEWFDE